MDDLIKLIESYSFSSIIIIFILLLLSIKGIYDTIIWIKSLFQKYHEKESEAENKEEDIHNKIKILDKYVKHEAHKDIEKRLEHLEKHDTNAQKRFDSISESINDLKKLMLEIQSSQEQNHITQDKVTVATCRSTLYKLHSEFCAQGYVTKEGLKTFLELGKVYVEAHGNDIYHEKLYPEVMALPIKSVK